MAADQINEELDRYRQRIHIFLLLLGTITLIPIWIICDYWDQPSWANFKLQTLLQCIVALTLAAIEVYAWYTTRKLRWYTRHYGSKQIGYSKWRNSYDPFKKGLAHYACSYITVSRLQEAEVNNPVFCWYESEPECQVAEIP